MDTLFLINPKVGLYADRDIADELDSELHVQNLHIQTAFIDPKRLEAQILTLAPSRDLVVVVGGDATVSAVARILATLNSPPPIAILPIGTKNDLARSLGWWRIWHSENSLTYFWSAVRASKAEAMDLWSCGKGLSFLGYAGFGLDARIVASVSRLRQCIFGHRFGERWNQLLYIAVGLKYIFSACIRGRSIDMDFSFFSDRMSKRQSLKGNTALILSNIRHYAGGGSLSQNSSWRDGKIEAYIIPSTRAYLGLLLRGHITSLSPPKASLQARSVEIIGKQNIPMQLDGEWIGECSAKETVKIQLIRALPVIIPPIDFGVREGVDSRWSKKTILEGDRVILDPATSGR
ncbi:MAG: hypothetical protein GWP10_01590 [Nitrospiraceae bacterium]|nr:hypothetical protein [Nitrospiraceae bacterium]